VRGQILSRLEENIAGSDSLAHAKRDELFGALSTRPAYKRFLRRTRSGLLRIDRGAVAKEKKLDGKFLLRTSDDSSPATANKYLACLRGILRAAWRLNQISTDQFHRAIDVPAIRGSRVLAGREVPHIERQALIEAACGGSPAAVRDRAVIAITYLSGARRGELAALELSDVDLGALRLRIVGKANKERLVPLAHDAARWLEPWIEMRGDVCAFRRFRPPVPVETGHLFRLIPAGVGVARSCSTRSGTSVG